MARCPSCGLITPTGCNCLVDDSDCFQITGDGSEGTPFGIVPILDADPDNIFSCSTSGFKAELPTTISNPPCCQVFRDSRQIIPNNILTAIEFDEEKYDTDGMHSAGAKTRITFNTAGVYLVTLSCTWQPNATGYRFAQIRKNGVDIIAFDSRDRQESIAAVGHNLACQESFAASDYIETMVRQNSGGNLQILARGKAFDNTLPPLFSTMRIGPTP